MGNGEYATTLHGILTKHPDIEAVTVSVMGERSSQLHEHDIDFSYAPGRAEEMYSFLHGHGLKTIVFAGDFRYARQSAAFRELLLDLARDAIERTGQAVIPASASLNLLLKRFTEGILSQGFEPELASKFDTSLMPRIGELHTPDRLRGKDIAGIAKALAAKSRKKLKDQPIKTARQVMAFDDSVLLPIITTGTDDMFQKLEKEEKAPGTLRVITKLCPPDYDYRIDPPVFSAQKISRAKSVGVDLIVLEGIRGILLDREDAIETARELKVGLYGLPPQN